MYCIYILYILMTVKVSYVYHVLWCFMTGVLGVIGVFKVWFLALLMWITGHHWTAWSWETYERNHLGCWSLWFQRGEFYLVARFRAIYIYINIYTLLYTVYIHIIYIYCVFNMFSWWVMMSHDESMFHALSPAFSDHSTRLAQRLRSQACLDVSGLWLSNTVH